MALCAARPGFVRFVFAANRKSGQQQPGKRLLSDVDFLSGASDGLQSMLHLLRSAPGQSQRRLIVWFQGIAALTLGRSGHANLAMANALHWRRSNHPQLRTWSMRWRAGQGRRSSRQLMEQESRVGTRGARAQNAWNPALRASDRRPTPRRHLSHPLATGHRSLVPGRSA